MLRKFVGQTPGSARDGVPSGSVPHLQQRGQRLAGCDRPTRASAAVQGDRPTIGAGALSGKTSGIGLATCDRLLIGQARPKGRAASMPLRIGVNALYLIPGGVGGTEIYLRSLLTALAEIDRHNHYFVFTNRETGPDLVPAQANFTRSEEHTSELQSLRHLVCRLLLE